MDDKVTIRVTARIRDEVMLEPGDAIMMSGERGRRFLRRWSRKTEEVKRRGRPAVSVAMAEAEVES